MLRLQSIIQELPNLFVNDAGVLPDMKFCS